MKGEWAKAQFKDHILMHKLDINTPCYDEHGTPLPALGWAVNRNRVRTAGHLIDLGATVNEPMGKEYALTMALKLNVYDGTEMVRVLLAKGADPKMAEAVPAEYSNMTTEYWINVAYKRRVFQQDKLKHFKLDEQR
eukprot:gene34-biopygen109881